MALAAPLGCGDKSGFPGTGRAQIVRSFILSAFLSRRKPEDHEAPRRFTVPHHRELRQRPTILESQGTEITLTDTQSDPTELER